jgi:hypothetical protein
MMFSQGGVQGRELAPPPAPEWASLLIYYLSEIRGPFVDTMARFFRQGKGCKRNPSIYRLVPSEGGSSGFIEGDLARGRLFRVHGAVLLRNARCAASSDSLA